MPRAPSRQLTIGTRASPLARAQTAHVAAALCAAHGWPDTAIAIRPIDTRGDAGLAIAQDTPLAEIGGKGLFTAELDAALADQTIDFAVHSLKDLPTSQPDHLVVAAIPPRADARDVMLTAPHVPLAAPDDPLASLPQGARLGTASLRRKAQLLRARPDLDVAPMRGNVGTRLDKLKSGDWGATLLAAAGLARLDLAPQTAQFLPLAQFVPAAGQGALAVQCRADDTALIDWLAPLHCPDTALAVGAERAFLAALDGSCRTPIAAHAQRHGDTLTLHGRLLAEDGSEMVEDMARCAADLDAALALGRATGETLYQAAPHLVRQP